MDPRRLLVLLAVEEAGSLTGAAARLGTTQQAVSQQVTRLEAEAGTALLVREGRGSSLTEAGRVLAARAEELAEVLRAAQDDLAALSGLVRGEVALAAFPTASAVVLPRALAALAARAPGLSVRLTEAEPPEAEAAVREGRAALALVFRYAGDSEPVPGDLLRVPLGSHRVHAVVPAGERPPPHLADLAERPWIAGCPRCRAHLVRCASAAGFTPDVRLETDDHVAVQHLVAAGLGVALLPSWALRASTVPGVVHAPLGGLDARAVELLLRPESQRVPAVRALASEVQRVVAEVDGAG
ncbi:LysR family transcriptional regulator [Quadrisphaera setariae]|uniref:LysR family transcriptional regulator n=1 Tax=Quadrisphaera setariae TaxID=2593304 RepID=A0A5C8ZIK2_9ACTN|nr:LysR family transcriptional regulator [Quadrisphaera setariae]TXR56756.1 LysR family transcriptional regulator [Quadrisphaera setariae]